MAVLCSPEYGGEHIPRYRNLIIIIIIDDTIKIVMKNWDYYIVYIMSVKRLDNQKLIKIL